MKFPRNISRHSQGFTLIEILVVVAIIAVLAALTITGISSAQVKAKTAETNARIKLLEDALERYHKDNGEYPTPTNKDQDGRFFGSTFNVGSGSCLYQALTGDGNDQILGYRTRQNETSGASIGELGSTGGQVYLADLQGATKSWFGKPESGSSYVILDGFRQPFQYQPRDPKNPDKNSTMHNETFDLWSYGNLKSPSDDEEAKAQWIKNW